MKKKKGMPQEFLIYQCDTIDGEPVYCATPDVDGVPEDSHGEKVGVYTLNEVYEFRVRRELK